VRGGGRDEAVRRWLPVVLWAGVIFAFSSIPSLGTGLGFWDVVLRKLAHAAEYAVLAVLLLRALGSVAAAWLAAVAYAVTDEVHQRFVSGRVGAPRDVLIDAAGAAAGLLAWRVLAHRGRAGKPA
jgi:VanZ family protein